MPSAVLAATSLAASPPVMGAATAPPGAAAAAAPASMAWLNAASAMTASAMKFSRAPAQDAPQHVGHCRWVVSPTWAGAVPA